MSRAFFSTVRIKKILYTRLHDYPASERLKFVCAVNLWSRAVL